MRWLRGLAWLLGSLLVLAAAAFAGLYWYVSNPTFDPRPLPPTLIALGTPEGQALLAAAVQADHPALTRAFQAQEKRSWCGVASAVTVLSAIRGAPMPQSDLFTNSEATAVRSWWQVTFGGMPLDALAGLLRANGVQATAHHADEGLAALRAALTRNLADPDDYMLVNWRRDVVGMEGQIGHISPVSAYDAAGDRVLILDVAAHVYPKTWVSVADLFAAMDTVDGDGGRKRGWVEVRP